MQTDRHLKIKIKSKLERDADGRTFEKIKKILARERCGQTDI